MHVAVVAPEFPPEIGGMQTYAFEFVRELASRGHRVTVFTRRRQEPQAQLPGVEVRGVLVGRRGPDLAQLREVRVDAWHVMNAAYAWVALHFAPTVVSVHGNDFLHPYIPVGEPDWSRWPGAWRLAGALAVLARGVGAWRTPRLVRAALRRATRILANSSYTQQVFLERFPECRGRVQPAMVGVAADFLNFVPPPRANTEPQLVTVCRLSERRKNVDLVLHALARLKDAFDFHFTVIGDGELRADLEVLSHRLGLGGRVSFTGFLPAQALRDRLAGSDLFVLTASVNPTSHEGFGIAYLEANACGTPTLAARLAGAAEAVEEGVSGYFTEGLEEEQVAAALLRFLSGELVFEREACRSFARRFTWARVVDQALPWYGGLADAGAGRPSAVVAEG